MIATCRAVTLWIACAPRRLLCVLVGITLTVTFAVADNRQPVPDLHARVTDLTNTLDIGQTKTLTSELEALETRKGSQIGVLIVPTTQSEDIAQYAIRVFDAWKLGRKGIDDGVLLIVAKNDRRVRIEVARGLEGAIPDVAAKRIIQEYVTPKFQGGDFYGGVEAATGMLTRLIDGEPLPPPSKTWDGLGVTPILGLSFVFLLSLLIGLIHLYKAGDPNVRPRAVLYLFRGATVLLTCAVIAVFSLLIFRCFGWQPLAAMTGLVLLAVFGKRFGIVRTVGVKDAGAGTEVDNRSSGTSNDSGRSSSDSGFSGGGGESAGGGASGSW